MAEDFLLEIGTEEIPASFLPQAIVTIREKAEALLGAHRLDYGSTEVLGTPRRLTLLVYGLEEKQADRVQEISGPPRSVAFDSEQRPTEALEKFCARHDVRPEDVSIVRKKKGEYVCIRRMEPGRRTEEVLAEILPGWIVSLPFPKSMRWGDLEIRFARPIRWIAALYGENPLSFHVGEVLSGGTTRGHRFLGQRQPIQVPRVGAYREILEKERVVVDPERRRERIMEQARRLAEEVRGEILEDDQLIETLVFITEYPVAIRGSFPERFLSLPQEVLVATMKDHQKYIAIREGGGGALLPYFVAVANVEAPDMLPIQRGNEKVLMARLEDARFFFEEDTKQPLERNLEALKQVVYHKKLGSSYDKVMRISSLAEYLGEQVCPERLETVRRAAWLCKADLVTQMVGEFPELQGIMGGIYAAVGGEPQGVADAIREHYLPVSADGDLPASSEGAVLSLADKMDTIVGFFGIGKPPVSGTSDPFGMRRRAIGILRILLGMGLEVSLQGFVEKSMEVLDGLVRRQPREQVRDEVVDFFRQRYHQLLLGRGFPYDTVEAVLARPLESIPDLYRRVEILDKMRSDPDFEKLILGCKRAVNILEQAKRELGYAAVEATLDDSELREDAERGLYQAMLRVQQDMDAALASKDYERVLRALVELKDPIDRLFDEVMVLVEDPQVRESRLKLLKGIAGLFGWFADFSKISL